MSRPTTTGVAAEVPPDDLGILLLCAFRYALGRKTFMPGVVAEMIQRYWSVLSDQDRLRIQAELSEALNASWREDVGRDTPWWQLGIEIL